MRFSPLKLVGDVKESSPIYFTDCERDFAAPCLELTREHSLPRERELPESHNSLRPIVRAVAPWRITPPGFPPRGLSISRCSVGAAQAALGRWSITLGSSLDTLPATGPSHGRGG